MASRIIRSPSDIDALATLLRSRKMPVTVTIAAGTPRTNEQNRLLRKWCGEVSEQMGDRTPEEIRGDAKLRFGVPILRHENEAFAATYDKHVKPLPYEQKLALMMEPLDMPVTRLMTTKQETEFLNGFHAFYAAQGVNLTVTE